LNMGQLLSIPFVLAGIFLILNSKNHTGSLFKRRVA
jgi:prolipoprotein diacylglyceryltransferase